MFYYYYPYKPNIYYIKHISIVTVTSPFMPLNFHVFPQLLKHSTTHDTLRELGPN